MTKPSLEINFFLLFFLSLLVSNSYGQLVLQVNEDFSNDKVIELLSNEHMTVSNVSYQDNVPNSTGFRPASGTYLDAVGLLDLNEGIILTTGAAVNAIGPNNDKNKEQIHESTFNDLPFFDPEIEQFVNQVSNEYDIYNSFSDYAILEYDVVSPSGIFALDFKYGSEEWPESQDKADLAAILISGPGINGYINLATLPNGTPISDGTISYTKNGEYYEPNGDGSTPSFNAYSQYDGFTSKLLAYAAITPCETYHIKIFILDTYSGKCDSGILFEPSSDFNGESNLSVSYEQDNFDYGIEGCNDAIVTLTRDESKRAIPQTFDITYSGTASSDDDYTGEISMIEFEEGEAEKSFQLSFTNDTLNEDEFVRVLVYEGCGTSPIDSIDIQIENSIEFELPDETICIHDSVQLFISADEEKDSIIWDPSPFLTCSECYSPIASPDTSMYFPYSYYIKGSACEVRDSVFIETQYVTAGFYSQTSEDYTTLDIFYFDTSSNATNYYWDFGDGQTSNEKNPLHFFSLGKEFKDSAIYVITQIVQNEIGCVDTATSTIQIGEPFFLPNIITPNGDDKNDHFHVSGIILDVWEMRIYNRWEDEVFYSDGYLNDFKGQDLADGVYFFEMSNPNKDRVFKGWLTVIR